MSMESVLARENIEDDERRSSRNMIFEYLVPSSCWTQDTHSHCLLIHLPGFKNEDVRIRADKHGHVIVSGERETNDNKIIHFEQSFRVPASCDIEETSATFEDEIFYVTVPKKVTPEKEVPEAQFQNSTSIQEHDHFQNSVSHDLENINDDDYGQNNNERTTREEEEDAKLADKSTEGSLVKNISKKLKKNISFVLTAVLAFSLGIVVSHCYQSNPQVEKSQ